jgi:hypothetical protein
MKSCGIILLACSIPTVLASQSPSLPFQGVLTDQGGAPVSITNSVSLVFRLYDQPISGQAIWEEAQPNVSVASGRFSVLLGSRVPLPDAKTFAASLYLGITIVDGQSQTADIEMRPRQAIIPVPAAIWANDSQKLAGHDWSDLLSGGSNDPSTGKVRLEKVDVSGLQVKIDSLTSSINTLTSQGQSLTAQVQSQAATLQSHSGTMGKLESEISSVNARVSGIHLTESGQTTLPEFACGGQAIATTDFTFMVGSRDGTSCGVPNVNWVRSIGLFIP